MSRSIENVSIFGEYKKPEDRVTAALLHVLNAGGQPLVERLFDGLFDLPSNEINIIPQSRKKDSIPDGEIQCDCKYNIYIESKIVPNAVDPTQLTNHLKLANPGDNKYLCYITPDLTKPSELENYPLVWLEWKKVIDSLNGFIADGKANEMLSFLIKQLIQLINHVVYNGSQTYMSIPEDERVIIVGGRWGEDIALEYGFYACQENRFFLPAKYIAFYHQQRIMHVFEIEDSPKIVDLKTISHIAESDYFKIKEPTYSGYRQYMKLKLVHTCNPIIQNDNKDKNGKPCAFIQGQTYTSYDKIKTATKTSQLK